MPHSRSSTPEDFAPQEREPNTTSDEADIDSAHSLTARLDFVFEETQRLRRLLRPSAPHSGERYSDRSLEQFQTSTEQNQASNTDNASIPRVEALGTSASPASSELAFDSENEINFMRMDPRELMGLQSGASARLPSLGMAYSPPSVTTHDTFPAMVSRQGASEDGLIDDRASIYYNIPGHWSPEPLASGALPVPPLSHEAQRSNAPFIDHWSHREELRRLERDSEIQQHGERMLREIVGNFGEQRDRGSFVIMPAMIPAINTDSSSMLPQLIPSLNFYPAGEIRRPEDNIDPPALQSGVREINQDAGSDSSLADRGVADVDGAMVEHIEDIRNHRLPRYYQLMEAYSHILRRWCLNVHHRVINHAHGIHLPASRLQRMPTIHSTFWDIGRHLLSQDHHRITTAVNRIQTFLLQWSEDRGPAQRILQSIHRVPMLEEFAELLLQEGMEQERRVWEPVVQLHTGRRLSALLLAYENLRIATRQRNRAMTAVRGRTSEEDQDAINMDIVDGIRPYRFFS